MNEAPLNRRTFLRGLAAAIPGVYCTTSSRALAGGIKADTIVIGAGISGLACAHSLSKAGLRVLVLEGRDRIGGRINTVNALGAKLDLGASWIHRAEGNPIYKLAQQSGARLVPTHYDPVEVYDDDGTQLSDKEINATYQRVKQVSDKIWRAHRHASPEESLAPIIDDALAATGLTPRQRRALQWALYSDICGDAGASFSDLSLAGWDEDLEFRGIDYQFSNGYAVILPQLAKGLDIRLNQVVRGIDSSSDEILVKTEEAVFSAPSVVVTLPLGVLQSGKVRFTPPLPERKQLAIRRLGMGLLNKVFIRFSEVFWPKSAEYFGCLGAKPRFDYFSMTAATGLPLLACFSAAREAAVLENKSDAEIVGLIVAQLKKIFGAQVKAVDFRVTRWKHDPFTLGSYSYIPVGGSYSDHEALGVPVDRLYFAGEATSDNYPATVHGAYLSGIKAAEKIVKRAG